MRAFDAREGDSTVKRIAALLASVAIPLSLTGCYEDATPVRYEPGVYKGGPDPLIYRLESGELHETLDDRVGQAFRDR